MWQLKNYRTLCLKSSKFRRSQKNNCGRPMNSVAVHPHAARGIFDYMNNHYFVYYGGIAWTTRKDTVRNCTRCVYRNGIMFCCSKHFLFSETKSFSLKKVCWFHLPCRASKDKLRTTHNTYRSCLLAWSFDPTTLIEIAVFTPEHTRQICNWKKKGKKWGPTKLNQ